MKKNLKRMKAMKRFAQFNAVGALGIGLQLTVLWVLVELWGVGFAIATPLAVGGAIVHNFLWHRRWTWGDRDTRGPKAVLAFARFVGTNGLVSIFGNLAVMFVLVGGAGVSPVVANLIAIATCGLINFAVSNQFVF